MSIILIPIINVIRILLHLYLWVVIIFVIMGWLTAFGVLNPYNRIVMVIQEILSRLTEPLLQPIRRVLPNLGGLDLSPLVLGLAIYLIGGILIQIQIALMT